MSKNSIPKGYSNKSTQDLQKEVQQTLFDLGNAHYNEEFSIRQQNKLQDKLEELEDAMRYAQQRDQAAAIAKKNAEARADNSTPVAEASAETSDVSQA